MKVLYLAPRYHTNQSFIMKGWIDHGDEVFFLSQYVGKSEDYSYITPEVIGYSGVFQVINFVYVNLLKRNNPYRGDWKLKYGFPPVYRLSKRLKQVRPDVVIIRERSVYSIVATMLCRWHCIPTILYNQSPIWEKPKPLDWKHKLVWKLVPEYRISPVMLTGIDFTDLEEDKKACWIPFVMEPQLEPFQKKYFSEGRIHILSVGKYEKRKNHFMMLQVFERLVADYPVHLTIAGECSNRFQEEYLKELKAYIKTHHLSDLVTIQINLNRNEIFELYKNADVFVLPSTGEPAAVSHLEAMSFCVPSVCSTGNGTANYIINGKTGFVFKDRDAKDLESKLRIILSDRNRIVEMGKEAYEHVRNQFQFINYYRNIVEIVEKIKSKNTEVKDKENKY